MAMKLIKGRDSIPPSSLHTPRTHDSHIALSETLTHFTSLIGTQRKDSFYIGIHLANFGPKTIYNNIAMVYSRLSPKMYSIEINRIYLQCLESKTKKCI